MIFRMKIIKKNKKISYLKMIMLIIKIINIKSIDRHNCFIEF